MQLTQKEKLYLKDAKSHEELCIAKYNHYTQAASCQELKQILSWAGQQEVNHLNTINQLLQGQIPQMGGQQGGMSAGQGGQQAQSQAGSISQMGNQAGQGGMKQQATIQQGRVITGQSYTGSMVSGASASQTQFTGQGMLSDQQMCTDLLSTEKAVSDMYDHAVFESTNQDLRQALSHIQREEQDHAFAIFQYMQQKGWYQTQ